MLALNENRATSSVLKPGEKGPLLVSDGIAEHMGSIKPHEMDLEGS